MYRSVRREVERDVSVERQRADRRTPAQEERQLADRVGIGDPAREGDLVSQKVFIKSFVKRQFPHESGLVSKGRRTRCFR